MGRLPPAAAAARVLGGYTRVPDWMSAPGIRPVFAGMSRPVPSVHARGRAPGRGFLSMLQPKSQSLVEEKVVPFTPEQFFEVVADVDRYGDFVPYCKGSKVSPDLAIDLAHVPPPKGPDAAHAIEPEHIRGRAHRRLPALHGNIRVARGG